MRIRSGLDRGTWAVVPVALTVCALLSWALPAGAQEDPYGGTTTTAPPVAPQPTCNIGVETAVPGQTLTAEVAFVPHGATVRILIDGVEAGRGTAPLAAQSAGGGVRFDGARLPAQVSTTSLSIGFQVPADIEPGPHSVTAVGPTFTVRCGPNPDGILQVLATTDGQGDGSSGGGSLPKTGVTLALLLVLAVLALLVGRALLRASRRRREEAARRARHRRRGGSDERPQPLDAARE